MESREMKLTGSWISATYLFLNKFKASNALLNGCEYTITRKSILVSLSTVKICLDTAPVVYT
jgi:hypothetical protein